ncbi:MULTISPECIES: hypothetical protein [Candidatus Ichthyocystis]|uniref:Uncharacterized protein n=1 Tax=Candidatus Ichthyocystis hellenicum TaxID=1561003 RepID=A0A0S4LZF8_9BURK|nr:MULTISPECIES: hypothetical protein [Ichthyocystis]CUT16947.1 hypothetical protein Ark11_0087 [Candidatus Ichthyocystis hellenicum]
MISLVSLEARHALHTQVILEWLNDLLFLSTRKKASKILVEVIKSCDTAKIGLSPSVLLNVDSGNKRLRFKQYKYLIAIDITDKLLAYLSFFRKYGFQCFKSSLVHYHIFKNSYQIVHTYCEVITVVALPIFIVSNDTLLFIVREMR